MLCSAGLHVGEGTTAQPHDEDDTARVRVPSVVMTVPGVRASSEVTLHGHIWLGSERKTRELGQARVLQAANRWVGEDRW